MRIQVESITKRFAGVTALEVVSLSIAGGECHGLMGENGAGKSTLGKILAGIYRPDGGTIRLDGTEYHAAGPRDALKAGIAMVHQELAFCPDLSIAENLVMGRYPRRMAMFLNRRAMRREADALLDRIGASLDVRRPMRGLSTAQEQLVQIAAAVGTDARTIIFDEPTSSLSEPEAEQLFHLIQTLRSRGVTIIYVSHRMPEVFRLCDRISVLRDGQYVGTVERGEATSDRVVQMMIGRTLESYLPHHTESAEREVLLRVKNLASPGKFAEVSFDLRAGEIIGFAGLVGAGRSEVATAVFGLDKSATGTIEMEDKPLRIGSVKAAMRRGIGLVPEDRKRQGLVTCMSGRANYSLAILDRLSRLGLLDRRTERMEAGQLFGRLQVKTPSLETAVAGLSGGNQQKIVLAKWIGRKGKVLIVDEPTRGVDVGAKAAIHQLIDELARQGVGIILISSEMPELLAMSSRIIVMREGRMVREISRENATQENVLRAMAGVA